MGYEEDDAADAAYRSGMRYRIRAEFLHPQLEEDRVSRETGWVSSGSEGAAPGCWHYDVERRGHRFFFRHLVELLDHLGERRSFVLQFLESGGTVVFTVRLYGRRNIGDMLTADEMMRMGRLGIALRIEVAPDWP